MRHLMDCVLVIQHIRGRTAPMSVSTNKPMGRTDDRRSSSGGNIIEALDDNPLASHPQAQLMQIKKPNHFMHALNDSVGSSNLGPKPEVVCSAPLQHLGDRKADMKASKKRIGRRKLSRPKVVLQSSDVGRARGLVQHRNQNFSVCGTTGMIWSRILFLNLIHY